MGNAMKITKIDDQSKQGVLPANYTELLDILAEIVADAAAKKMITTAQGD